MPGDCNEHLYSLVGYLPRPLAEFIDPMRRALVPGCEARAHVTVLPPRHIACSSEHAVDRLRHGLEDSAPFRVVLGEVRVFPVSNTLYLEITEGLDQLGELHQITNSGCLRATEGFNYHPHVTLAQNLEGEELSRALVGAQQSWRDYQGPRDFRLERLTFVHKVADNTWVDLAEFALDVPVPAF